MESTERYHHLVEHPRWVTIVTKAENALQGGPASTYFGNHLYPASIRGYSIYYEGPKDDRRSPKDVCAVEHRSLCAFVSAPSSDTVAAPSSDTVDLLLRAFMELGMEGQSRFLQHIGARSTAAGAASGAAAAGRGGSATTAATATPPAGLHAYHQALLPGPPAATHEGYAAAGGPGSRAW